MQLYTNTMHLKYLKICGHVLKPYYVYGLYLPRQSQMGLFLPLLNFVVGVANGVLKSTGIFHNDFFTFGKRDLMAVWGMI